MDIKNMNIWKSNIKEITIENPSTRCDLSRLSQFEDSGFKLKDCGDFIIIEGHKLFATTCFSIDEAETIVNLAIQLKSKNELNIEPKPRRHILDKAKLLIGRQNC